MNSTGQRTFSLFFYSLSTQRGHTFNERKRTNIDRKGKNERTFSLLGRVELFTRHKYTCNSISLSLTRVFTVDAMIGKHEQMNVAAHICISIGEPSNYQWLRTEKKKENSTKTEKEKANDDVSRR